MNKYCNNCRDEIASIIIRCQGDEILCCSDCLPELQETANRKNWKIIIDRIPDEKQTMLF